ncbi:MAG: aminotransferase class V-fold PLP-dependent enzyme, partial [Synergistaceae bacterium]|nr:aminotransferase class V-fold PLP-dependent enzyme [Synergistaceae bacterium]
ALLLLDGAQSVPHLPVDVRSLDCDFLAFSGHKMLGPFGIGVLYGRQELLEQMSPFLYGGDMIRSVTLAGSTWNDLPWKFEAGTPDIAAGVALGGAFDPESRERLPGAMDYLSSLGMAEIRAHELDLIEAFLSGIGTVPGIRTYGPENTRLRSGLVSFNAEGADPFLLAELLDRRGISVRAGSLCAYPLLSALGETGMIRFSPYVYNTREEVARLVESVREILACEIV